MVFAEGLLIFWNRHSINRFKAVDEDGYMAFDSATGQICRTGTRLPKQKVFSVDAGIGTTILPIRGYSVPEEPWRALKPGG